MRLIDAIKTNDINVVRTVLNSTEYQNKHLDLINTESEKEMKSPLACALELNNFEIALLLIDNGANPSSAGEDKENDLNALRFYAAKHGYLLIV